MIKADLKLKYLGFIPWSNNNRPLCLTGTKNGKNSSTRNEAPSTDTINLWRALLKHTANIMLVYIFQRDTSESMTQTPYTAGVL